MNLFIIRHGEADSQSETPQDPPLASSGVEKVTLVAKEVTGKVQAPEALFSSPLKRALQTSEIIAQSWSLEIQTADWLLPGVEPSHILNELKSLQVKNLALVGHLPTLGWLFSVLLWGVPPKEIVVPKASISLIETSEWEPSAGKIRWMTSPALLE